MAHNKCSLPVVFSVNYETDNKVDRFLSVTIDVLHTGLNYNQSVFEKEVVDSCVDSIKNTPILGYIRQLPDGEKDFKGHEYILTKIDEDGVQRKYIGSAYGVIPESCNPRWITKECDDGIEREFLQVDGIVWTKFSDASDILLKDIEKPHSMELYPDNIEGYEDDDGIFHFTKFDFNGCCILGSDKEPAMINSNVIVQFTVNDFVKNIQSELNDKYNAFMKCKENDKEGGNEPMSQQNDFTLTLNQKIQSLAQIVNDYEIYKDRWDYEWSRYTLVDVQENEVIVCDRKDHYNYYGIPYTVEGDKFNVDFACAKRKKVTYEDLEDGSTTETIFDFEGEINSIGDKLFAKVTDANIQLEAVNTQLQESNNNMETMQNDYTQVKQDYESLKQDYDNVKQKCDEYERKEQEQIAEQLEADKAAQFERFESVLGDNAEFAALKEKKDELSVQEIEDKCSVLYARMNLNSFSKNNSNNGALGIMDDTNGAESNYVRTKYGDIPVNK